VPNPDYNGVLSTVNLHLVDSMGQAEEFLSWLGRSREVLGLDTESGGFDHKRDELRMYQFGDLHDGWAIPWHRWSGLIIQALAQYTGPVVLHNAPHDVKFTQQNAPELGPWPWDRTNDTLTVLHLVNPLRPKSLKDGGALYIDPAARAAQKVLDDAMAQHKWTWATVPWNFPPYWIYAAMDPVLTCHIFDKFKNETIHGRPREAYTLELSTLRVVTGMMIRGARVDLQYCQKKTAEMGLQAQQILSYLSAEYGVNSAGSSGQLQRAFDHFGIGIPSKHTKGGQQSFDKEVLEGIDHDLARYVLYVRKIEKQLGPYFRNFQRMADDDDRVHATIWSMGARTGRQQIEKPALQTLPKKDPTVRGAFIPAEGHVLISIDADQIEARLAAHFSKDAGMIEAFSGTDDFFVALGRQIFQDQTLQKDDLRRGLVKNTIYGRIYGAGPVKMAASSHVPLEQMLEFVEIFNQIFPGVYQLQQRVNNTGAQRKRTEGEAYIWTPYGRKLAADDDREYTLLNYLIQGHASEILKRCMVELDANGLGDFLILPVHDELLLEVPTEMANDVLQLAELVMNDNSNYAVPITWSGEIMTKNWGEKYEKAA
jgi:DNA polymerase I-like protein with 3'-5' exonuclease and polymerase domains